MLKGRYFFLPKNKKHGKIVLIPLPIYSVIFLIRNIYHSKNSKFNRISIVNHVLTTVPHMEDRLPCNNVSNQNVAFSLKIKGVFLSLSPEPFLLLLLLLLLLLNLKTGFAFLSIVKSGEKY